MDDYERPIYEDHEAMLKTVCGIDEDGELPKHVVKKYWQMERALRKVHCSFTHETLALVSVLADTVAEPPPESFLDVAQTLSRNDRVLAKFRNGWRWGKYQHVRPEIPAIVVQLDSEDAEDREFTPTKVRLPTREELKAIGEKK